MVRIPSSPGTIVANPVLLVDLYLMHCECTKAVVFLQSHEKQFRMHMQRLRITELNDTQMARYQKTIRQNGPEPIDAR